MPYDLLLVGCGNMGRAMLEGWQEAGLIGQAVVVEPNSQPTSCHPEERSDEGSSTSEKIPRFTWNDIRFIDSAEQLDSTFTPDIVVLAVKPQVLADVLPAYNRFTGKAAFLSIAAGKTIAFFEKHLGAEAAMIRAMPNLPATIRQGVSVCAANGNVNPSQRNMAQALLQAVGTVHWADEGQIDAVTALSGSGPAYVFLMQEALQQAGEKLGLAADLAAALARETIAGSAALLAGSDVDAATLRARVTSKGGTTEAALKILMENDALSALYASALAAAARRARELAD